MPDHVKEKQFESDVVEWLTTAGGYSAGVPSFYDREAGVDSSEVFAFIGATQAEQWEKLVVRYGGDRDVAQQKFRSRLVSELDKRGTVAVLREGIEDQGLRFALAYFRPASGMNAKLAELYGKNRLTVTRQLYYSKDNKNSLDLCLFVNGIPVATAELKNPLNGQTVDHAIAQYKSDARDPRDVLLGTRALVHFAVDPHLVYMTTRLAKNATEFLPFNRGSAPGALSCGEGNPPNPEGYQTAYLWEQVWSYDNWLDILHRFVESFEPEKKGKARKVIFPRFHQWDAVRKLTSAVLANGVGESYLIQHSAGSGKSNSIGWLSHHLSELHDASDTKVFDKVVVVTDRRVLDEQLRATVQQFQKMKGAIVSVEGKAGAKSTELAEALTGKAQIVTVTLETFPYVIAKIADADLSSKRYAVIVDEAHSSQTGEAARALKQALGAGTGDPVPEEDDEPFDSEAALAAVVASRGKQPNLSFFAFTATPKDRTIELFGTPNADGYKQPFHLYTMRQAIQEKFILDVLANYTTYATYYRLTAATPEAAEEEVEVAKATAAIRRFVAKNPALIKQKAAIIVEHFRMHTAKALGGRAKAMVVTDSRPAAVKYKQAIDQHIKDNKITDVRALVAFSGTVQDDVLGPVTESLMNDFPESQTGARFKGTPPFSPGDYQVLIVAEKFQTGFDEPYLHTMFVDKALSGLNAVQTLSRLNRTAPGKDTTFVLDFRNTAEDIAEAFQRYYEAVIVEPTSPNVLYDLRTRILDVGILEDDEVIAASDAYFGVDPEKRSLKAIYAAVDPAVERFNDLDDDDQAELRDALDRFIRAYAFLSQVMPFTDPDLERLYVYSKALQACLPKQATGGLDLGSDIVLTHLRLVSTGTSSPELDAGDIEPGKPFPGEGHAAARKEGEKDQLSDILDEINERFGADLDERDRLELEKIKQTLLDRDDLKTFAEANTEENYALEFKPIFKGAILDQEERNRRLYELLLGKPELTALLERELMRETYQELRAGDAEL